MIKTFADNETEKIFNQQFSRALPSDIQQIILRKLIMLDSAENINDIRIPPSNHLEKLTGKLKGQYSIRVNRQYRICFKIFNYSEIYDVRVTDYH